MSDGNRDLFDRRCSEVREAALKMRNPLIVNHYDADGLAAGAAVALALKKNGIQARNLTVRKLSEKEMDELRGENELIFADLGGGSIAELEKRFSGKNVLVIDHHQTAESGILQANPCLFGFDGARDASGGSMAWFVFREPEILPLGVVGAVGDMQTPLQGLNRQMVEEGMRNGMLKVSHDLVLFGHVSRPLVWFLQYCSEPYLPGLTGKQAACAQFLKELGIQLKDGERWRKYFELTFEEKQRIVSGLVVHLYEKEVDVETIRGLVGEVYTFPKEVPGSEKSDAHEYATMLNASGRHDKPEIGLRAAMGDEGAMEEVRKLLSLHRRMLREGVEFASRNVEEFDSFHFIDARGVIDDGIIGVVAGMLYGGSISRDKPVLAIALNEEGEVKVSARGTKKLIERGLDLNLALRKACEGIGQGGGHDIAAGAQVKADALNGFLLRFGEEVEKQIHSS